MIIDHVQAYRLYSDGDSMVLVGPNGSTYVSAYCIPGVSWILDGTGRGVEIDLRSFCSVYVDSNTKPPNIVNLDKISINDLLKIVYQKLSEREQDCKQLKSNESR